MGEGRFYGSRLAEYLPLSAGSGEKGLPSFVGLPGMDISAFK